MVYCYDKRYSLESFEEEIMSCRKEHEVFFYDEDKENFVDINGNVASLQNKVVLGRTWAGHIQELDDEITVKGGTLAITRQDTEKIRLWPNYYHPKRKTFVLTGRELIRKQVAAKLEQTFGKEMFIKTVDKNFHSVVPVSLLKKEDCAFYQTLQRHQDDQFIVSEKVNILNDEYGSMEYRAFIMNGKIANISRMTDEVMHAIDCDVFNRIQEIMEEMKDIFPDFYVVDVFCYKGLSEKEIDVVEFNPFQASGCYLYNSAVEMSVDLLHQDFMHVPREREKNLHRMTTDGKMIISREPKYDAFFSFANDLRSMIVSGQFGVIHTTAVIRCEDFSKPVKKRNSLSTLKKVMRDADLLGSVSSEEGTLCSDKVLLKEK